MYNETRLQAIKLFWKKDLKYGSLLLISADKYCDELYSIWNDLYGNTTPKTYPISISEKEIEFMQDYWDGWSNFFKRKVIEILWHEPHLEDLFRVAEKEWYKTELTIDGAILFFRTDQADFVTFEESIELNKTLPFIDQPNLSEIVNLFQ